MSAATVAVRLPAHLRSLAKVDGEVRVEVDEGPVSAARVLDALEARYPMLLGTIRDHGGGERRAFIRYFACGADVSHESAEAPLPEAVREGREPFIVIGAISGG